MLFVSQDLSIVGNPHCSAFAISSTNPQVNVFVLADLMEEKGKT